MCGRVYVCLCIGVCPSNTTNAEPITPFVTSVEAPYYALHPPMPASKTILSSWSLVVICALILRGKFKPELEVQSGTSSFFFFFQAGTSSYHALCKYENIGYVEVPKDHLYNTHDSERSDQSPCLVVACVQVPVRTLLLLLFSSHYNVLGENIHRRLLHKRRNPPPAHTPTYCNPRFWG